MERIPASPCPCCTDCLPSQRIMNERGGFLQAMIDLEAARAALGNEECADEEKVCSVADGTTVA